MARSERQKLKLLYLVRLLEAESDQSHPVTVSQMLSYLEEHGIRAERKSVYDDLAALEEFGLDLEHRPGRTNKEQHLASFFGILVLDNLI